MEAASCMGKRRAYELAGQRTVKSHFSNNRDVTVNFSCAKWCLTSVIVIAEQTQDLVPFDAQGFFPLLAHIYWGMGRPSGTIETKFTEEDTNRIVSSVDSAKVGDVILRVLLSAGLSWKRMPTSSNRCLKLPRSIQFTLIRAFASFFACFED